MRSIVGWIAVWLLFAVVAGEAAAAPPTAKNTVSKQSLGENEAVPDCRDLTARHERERRIPAHLLAAIAMVESARSLPDRAAAPDRPAAIAWPWTVYAQGRGSYHESKAAAIAHVQRLQAAGVRSIDVGCMQINLHFHPRAFADLDEAFDPEANVAYGAGYLKRLFHERRAWSRAIRHYHSATPRHGIRYGAKVRAAWRVERRRAYQERRRRTLAAHQARRAAAGRSRTVSP